MAAKLYTSTTDPALITDLIQGKVGVLLSDTVYGLVCSAKDTAAVERLYALKKPEQKPGIVVAAKIQHFIDLGIPGRYVKAVEGYWPNPLSVIVPCINTLQYIHQGKQTLAVRIPADDTFRELLTKTGPLVTTNANAPGEPVATDIAQAKAYFGDSVDFYVDSGTAPDRLPSTIIQILDDAIEVVRAGALNIDENGRIHE